MTIRPSELARFNGRMWPRCERSVSPSSTEPMSMAELIALADNESMALWERCRLDYAMMAGMPLLREEVAGLYETVDAAGILGFAGAQEGIFCVMHGLLSAGDHVVAITPCYEALSAVPRAIGADVTEVRLRHEEGWRLDVDRVEVAVRPDTKLLVLNFPHNPTGATLGPGELERLLAIAARAGARVLSDEVFRLLDPDEPAPAADLYDRAISLDVMSKAWGLGGVRFGWIATRDADALAAARGVKGWTSICTGAPDEILALMAIRARGKILARNRLIVAGNLALLDAFFERSTDAIEWVRPRVGCLGFPLLLACDPDALAERLASEAKTHLLPGRLFFEEDPHFRLGFGQSGLPAALERLEAGLR